MTRAATSCPHCGGAIARSSLVLAALGAIGSGALAVTLMACYGCPDCATGTYCPATGTTAVDDAACPDGGSTDARGADVQVPGDAGADVTEDRANDAADADGG